MDNQRKIENLLKNNLQGLTIQDLSNKSNLSRITVSKILSKLEGGETKVKMRRIGQAKLYFWEKKVTDSKRRGERR